MIAYKKDRQSYDNIIAIENEKVDTWLRQRCNHKIRSNIHRRNESSKALKNLMMMHPKGSNETKEKLSNLLFAGPTIDNDNEWKSLEKIVSINKTNTETYRQNFCKLDFNKTGEKVHKAIQIIKEFDKYGRTTIGGMSESTLMTEYKRKQIMSALLDQNELVADHMIIDPKRRDVQDKLAIYLQLYYPDIDDANLLSLEGSSRQEVIKKCVLSSDSVSTNNKLKTASNKCTVDSIRKLSKTADFQSLKSLKKEAPIFDAKWGNYDTMKQRWKYLRPQVKRLFNVENLLVPMSSDRFITLKDGTKLTGSLEDVEHFHRKKDEMLSSDKQRHIFF